MVRLARLWLAIASACLLPLALAPIAAGASADAPGEQSAAQQLAERYAPITMVREQRDPPCDTAEEQYQPTSVETVLGNPAVTLTRDAPDGGIEEVSRAPTAEDIAGLGEGYYLDLPGKVLGKDCTYAKDFRQLKREGKAPVVTYAHIAREAGRSGFALQYWFFWYFNQFNDLHEGDWEGMQITFGAESPQAALAADEEPSEVILFQHGGGERAEWGDGKLRKEGDHPIVHPAAGSHATFYDAAVYVQNGRKGSGVGCDNTTEPLRELRPTPVLLPDQASEHGPFKWLSYTGRWGEREKGYNNGPTGPATKTQWNEPFTWMEAQRSSSPRLPGGSVAGPQVTGVFCGVIAAVSDLINLDAQSRPAAIGVVLGIVLLIALFIGLTRWGPVDLERLRARRYFGQLVRTARALYGRYWKTLVAIGLTALPVVGGVNLLAQAVADNSSIDDTAGHTGLSLAAADLLEGTVRPIAQAVVAAVVVVFVRQLVEAGAPARFAACWRGMRERFWRVVSAQLLATLGVLALALTVVGLPIAIYKYVAWSFVQQEVLFTDKSIRDAFRGSSALVRGRWWHTVRVAGFLAIVAIAAGPALTLGLIFTSLPLIAINLLGSLVFALMIPYVAIGNTLLYFDLQARADAEPAKPRRSWKPWRPRRFGRIAPDSGPQPAPSG